VYSFQGIPLPASSVGAMHVTESDLAKFGLLQLFNIRFESKILPNDVMQQLKSVLNRDLLRPVAYMSL